MSPGQHDFIPEKNTLIVILYNISSYLFTCLLA